MYSSCAEVVFNLQGPALNAATALGGALRGDEWELPQDSLSEQEVERDAEQEVQWKRDAER